MQRQRDGARRFPLSSKVGRMGDTAGYLRVLARARARSAAKNWAEAAALR